VGGGTCPGFGRVGQGPGQDPGGARLLPFARAAVWWFFADSTGLTQRKAMDKIDAKREARRQKNLDAMGMGLDKGKKKR